MVASNSMAIKRTKIISTEAEMQVGNDKAHGKSWVLLRQDCASSIPEISTSRPPKSGWSFSRMR